MIRGLQMRKFTYFAAFVVGGVIANVAAARADVVNLICKGNTSGYPFVELDWIDSGNNTVSTVTSPTGDIKDALLRAQRGEMKVYGVATTSAEYKWTAYNGADAAVSVDRMTGHLKGHDSSSSWESQCSKGTTPLPKPKL